MMRIVSLLSLLWSLVGIHSQQTFPYIFFMNQTLDNHSYVDLGQVGDYGSGEEGVRCITDLNTCCSGTEGPHRGDWYFPDETRLPFSGDGGDIFEGRGSQRVDLRRRNNTNSPVGIYRNNTNSPVGIYRCDIPTVAIHVDNRNLVRDTVYVGLYTASGGD